MRTSSARRRQPQTTTLRRSITRFAHNDGRGSHKSRVRATLSVAEDENPFSPSRPTVANTSTMPPSFCTVTMETKSAAEQEYCRSDEAKIPERERGRRWRRFGPRIAR